MNHKATFDNTVGILVKAYLEGTLLKGSCHACAVGNICATAIGTRVTNVDRAWFGSAAEWAFGSPYWASVFMTNAEGQMRRPDRYVGAAKEQIDATGYTWQQLAEIEKVFEGAEYGETEAAEFAGLMAVVDVLADIHGVDLSATQAAKDLFVKA